MLLCSNSLRVNLPRLSNGGNKRPEMNDCGTRRWNSQFWSPFVHPTKGQFKKHFVYCRDLGRLAVTRRTYRGLTSILAPRLKFLNKNRAQKLPGGVLPVCKSHEIAGCRSRVSQSGQVKNIAPRAARQVWHKLRCRPISSRYPNGNNVSNSMKKIWMQQCLPSFRVARGNKSVMSVIPMRVQS